MVWSMSRASQFLVDDDPTLPLLDTNNTRPNLTKSRLLTLFTLSPFGCGFAAVCYGLAR
jgi:hypothetical protein